MDELHGILTTYEMRAVKEKPSKKQATFKASKKTRNRYNKSSNSFDKESNVEESHFMRKLKKGSKEYKGKILLKCFNCGKVGHFSTKYPYAKNESIDDEVDHNIKKRKTYQQKKNYKMGKHDKKNNFHKQKKILNSKEDSISYEEGDECISNSDREDIFFMTIDTKFDAIENEDKGEKWI